MAAITAGMVKELREMTGAGMMDCKKALGATDGDMEKAVEFLREKGLAAATKKASRIAAEGVSFTKVIDDKKAVVVEVNSETDFVAKNPDFQAYVYEVADQALASAEADVTEAFMAEKWISDETKTVAEALSGKVAVIGEKLSIRRFAKAEADLVVGYTHGGGRIGVLVTADCDNVTENVKEAVKNIAMQVAALRPQYVSEEVVPAEFIVKEREILSAQAAADESLKGKPEKVIAGIVEGRLKKEMKDFCLTSQVYVKAEDGKQSVGQYVAQVAKAEGCTLKITNFVRFETGEGMQKKTENFAEEVAKQMAGN